MIQITVHLAGTDGTHDCNSAILCAIMERLCLYIAAVVYVGHCQFKCITQLSYVPF